MTRILDGSRDAAAISNSRQKALMEKSEELRQEWMRAERAEAEADALRASLAEAVEVLKLSHSLMRQTGWQLAPASEPQSEDGAIEYALAEAEDRVAALLTRLELSPLSAPGNPQASGRNAP